MGNMRIGRREVKHRLTGLTFPSVLGTGGGGATWEVQPSEKALATTVLQYLEDRRVLYELNEAEQPRACITSVYEMRKRMADFVSEAQSRELRNSLRAIQAACREFLSETEKMRSYPARQRLLFDRRKIYERMFGTESWQFNQEIGLLRARVGTSVAILVETFGIDVDDCLSKILPPSTGEDQL
jgi:hypothetical protein